MYLGLSPIDAEDLNVYFELVVPAARKQYVSGQGFLFKKLSTQSPLQALERQHARLSRSGPGFDPRSVQVSWVRFFRGFSSPVRQMSGSFRPPQGPRISFGHHYHQSSFITGANDLRC